MLTVIGFFMVKVIFTSSMPIQTNGKKSIGFSLHIV